MPILFVGVQVFGAAGWTWSTGSVSRVSCLAYSLALYTATIGPLAHMQAERRAFWILRSVPVPLERLLAAKARAWAAIIGGIAAVAFFPLAFAAPAPAVNRFVAGMLVVVGASWMSYLAVAMAASRARSTPSCSWAASTTSSSSAAPPSGWRASCSTCS
jgi:uncharacterized protein YbdZ (MbtH family)